MRRTNAPVLLGCLAALVLAGPIRAFEILPADAVPVDGAVSHDGGGVTYESGETLYLPRFWAEADYLVVWSKSAPVPPVLTTGPTDLLDPTATPGTLGQPGTVTLLGDQNLRYPASSGARFVLGGWIDHGCKFGVEGSYFFLEHQAEQRTFSAPGTPGSAPLAIPFFNAATQMESSIPIAFARAVNPIRGMAELSVSNKAHGYEGNVLCCLCETPAYRLDVLVGYRHVNVDEDLRFNTSSSNVGQFDIFQTSDRFHCINDFNGGQVGLRQQVYMGRLFLRATGKLAVGNMHQQTQINGSLVTNDFPELAGMTTVFRGGYLAQPTNIGSFSRDRIAVVPEVNAGVGLHVCSWLRVSVSYTFLYLSSVMRPGDQIDHTINPTQAPAIIGTSNAVLTGPARPAFPAQSTDYWIQGLSVGLEVRF